MYHTNPDASRALGINVRLFARLCRQFGIQTPYVRKRERSAKAGTRADGS